MSTHTSHTEGRAGRRSIDIVAAVRNEEKFLPGFIERVERLSLPDGVDVGMIFVEDSSTDGTVALLREYARSRDRLRYYTLDRGFGQCAAIAFGLDASEADAVIMMDADGEHPPEVIVEMVQHYLDGADCVQCVRESRQVGQAWRTAASSAFNGVAWILTGVKLTEQNVYFRLVTRGFLRELLADNKWLHFLRIGARHARGRRVDHVRFTAVTSEDRRSTYGLGRLFRLASDALLSLVSPARLIVMTGLCIALAGLCFVRGLPAVGVVVILATGFVIYRYLAMSRQRLVDRLQVTESGP